MSGGCLCKNISHLLEDNLKLTRLNESVVCWMASIPAEWEKGGDIINLPPLSLQKMIEDMKSWIKEIPAELRNQLENEGVEDPEELERSQQPEYDCIKLEDTHDEMEQKMMRQLQKLIQRARFEYQESQTFTFLQKKLNPNPVPTLY